MVHISLLRCANTSVDATLVCSPPGVGHMVVHHPGHGADVKAVVGVVHEARIGGQHRRRVQLLQPGAVLQRNNVCRAIALL